MNEINSFKYTKICFITIMIYHVLWVIYGLCEHYFHWGNGTESLLFFYSLSLCFMGVFPVFLESKFLCLAIYSVVFFTFIGLFLDVFRFALFKIKDISRNRKT